jgi:hypothetical protein
MPAMRALLLFPLRPGDASRALARRPWGLAAPLFPCFALATWLWMRDCPTRDIGPITFGLLLLLVGLGAGGALGSLPAGFVSGAVRSPWRMLSPCFAFASWTALLFTAVLLVLILIGAGGQSVLFAGFFVLGWGVAAGTAVTTTEEGSEGGRALVASCLGLAGSVGGLWLALLVVQAQFAFVLPAPVEHGPITSGDVLVVRPESRVTDSGELVFLRDPGSGSVVLAELDIDGENVFIGLDKTAPLLSTNWDTLGRVCFAFGGSGGGNGVFPQRASN